MGYFQTSASRTRLFCRRQAYGRIRGADNGLELECYKCGGCDSGALRSWDWPFWCRRWRTPKKRLPRHGAPWPTWPKKCRAGRRRITASRATTTGTVLGRCTSPRLSPTRFRRRRWKVPPVGCAARRAGMRIGAMRLSVIRSWPASSFAASLLAAREAGLLDEPAALVRAAESLLPHQEPDGSWQVDAAGSVGSPTTWGAHLATLFARRVLVAAGSERFLAAAARAEGWLLAEPLRAVIDAAATVMALADRAPPRDDRSHAHVKLGEAIDLLLRVQASDGGWGPYARSPSEPFDTAVAVLALTSLHESQYQKPIAQGRAYLLKTQLPAGGWPETTRPPGAQSYAQHISTSAWATLALLSAK